MHIRNHSASRYPIFVVLLLIVCACSKREPMEIMKEYEIGFLNDNEIRTYYYFRIPENDTVMVRFSPSAEQGIRYVTEFSYTRKMKISRRKFSIDRNRKELVEQIFFYYADPVVSDDHSVVKADIIDHEIIKGEKYDGGNYYLRFTTPADIVSKVRVIETFEKDTVYNWNGEVLPALKFKDVTTYKTFYRYLPFAKNSKLNAQGYVLFTKGVGIVYYKIDSESYSNIQTLIKVEIAKEKITL
jgi:hypothetical protein